MTRSYDHRQLVKAHTKLADALEHIRWALARLDNGNAESALRVVFAIREMESALIDLRRFARRHGEKTP